MRAETSGSSGSNQTIRLVTDAVVLRWRLILLIVVTVPVLIVAASRFYRPPYVASASILIQENRSINPFLGDMMVDLQVQSRFPVVSNVLQSRTIIEEILRDLGELTPESTPNQVNGRITQFQDSLQLENSGGGVITIQVRAGSSEQAYTRVQAVMDALLEEMLRPQRESLDASVAFLEQQLARMSGELSDAEERLRVFKEEHAEDLPEVFEGNLQRYLDTLAELPQVQADLAVAERQLTLSEEELQAYAMDPILNQLEQDLVQARNRYERLLGDYTENHPSVREAARRMRALETEIEQRRRNPDPVSMDDLEEGAETSIQIDGAGGTRVLAGNLMTGELLTHRAVRSDVESLRLRVQRLEAQRDELRELVASYAGNEQALNEIIREVDAKSELYDELLRRYQDSVLTRELTLQSESSRVWTIQAPTRPPDDNRIPMRVAAVNGLLLGLALAGGIVFVAEYLDRTVRLPSGAEVLCGVPTVAVLPKLVRPS